MNGSGSAVSNSISLISQSHRIPRDLVYRSRITVKYIDSINNDVAVKASVIRDLLSMTHDLRYGRQSPLNSDEICFALECLCTE